MFAVQLIQLASLAMSFSIYLLISRWPLEQWSPTLTNASWFNPLFSDTQFLLSADPHNYFCEHRESHRSKPFELLLQALHDFLVSVVSTHNNSQKPAGAPFAAMTPSLYDFGEKSRAVEELSVAEKNLDSILEASKRVQKILSPIKAADFNPDHLERLIADLKAIYSEIRRQIQTYDPRINLRGGKVRGNRDRSPPSSLDKYPCICPLTIFLQMVAQSLTRSYMNIIINYKNFQPPPQGQNATPNAAWGDVEPLRRTLASLSQQLKTMQEDPENNSEPYYPAVSQCLMFHNENSQLAVTSSSTRYAFLPGLSAIGRRNRQGHIRDLATKCTPEVQNRIMAVENASTNLYTTTKTQNTKDKNWNNPFLSDGGQVQVPGQGATFSPKGDYRLACLVDYCRFVMEKPHNATKKEKKGKNRRAYEYDSCAEWELWITILSESRTPMAPARYPRKAQLGGPKSNSYPRPQPSVPAGRPSKANSGDWPAPPPQQRQPARNQQPQSHYPQGPPPNGVQQRPPAQRKKKSSWCCF